MKSGQEALTLLQGKVGLIVYTIGIIIDKRSKYKMKKKDLSQYTGVGGPPHFMLLLQYLVCAYYRDFCSESSLQHDVVFIINF